MQFPHPDDQILKAYGLGKLDTQQARTVNDHLEVCADCRQRISGLTSDSFLDRFRQGRLPSDRSTGGTSIVDGTMSFVQAPAASSPPSADTLPAGLANHPDYEIKRELGRGGMGVVYLAHNMLMGRDEVLKVMGRQIMERPGVLERFLREIRAVAKLRHPNIVTAYAATRMGDSIVFGMEYVEGLDLSKMVKAKGTLPVAHACNFIHQAALGLQHAHEKGLVHRDIKPHNLMLSRDGNKPTVKVLDFGLAKLAREEKVDVALTTEGQALGTPDYIAPEQIIDAQGADIRADIYSLGGSLYFLLAGRPPFKANSLYDMYQSHISREPDPLNLVRSEVPSELACLVAKMMAKDPARRFQTPGEVAEALKPFFKKANAAFKNPKTDFSQVGPTEGGLPEAGGVSRPTQPATDVGGVFIRAKKATDPTVPESRWESLIDFKESDSPLEKSKLGPAGTSPSPPWRKAIMASCAGMIALGVIVIIIRSHHSETKIAAPVGTGSKVDADKIVITTPLTKIDPASSGLPGVSTSNLAIPSQASGTTPPEMPSAPAYGVAPPTKGTDLAAKGPTTESNGGRPAPVSPGMISKSLGSQAESTGFVHLLSGNNLAGWSSDTGTFENVRLKNGVIEMNGASLLSERSYSEFNLRCEFQLAEGTNSGISFWAAPGEQNLRICLMNLSSDPKIGHLSWGANRGGIHFTETKNSELKAAGQWNELVFEARDDLLRTQVNGREILLMNPQELAGHDYAKPGLIRREGRIGLGASKGLARFRNLEIQELPGSSLQRGVGKLAAAHASSPGNAIKAGKQAVKPGPIVAASPPKMYTNASGIKLVLIPAGEFMMGMTPDAIKEYLRLVRLRKDARFFEGQFRAAPSHRVMLTKPWLMGATEVTIGQFREFVEATQYETDAERYGFGNSSAKKIDVSVTDEMKKMNWRTPGYAVTADSPVTQVTWSEAILFCNWLSEREKLKPCYEQDSNGNWLMLTTGEGYRLPTEAEWEYACRGSSTNEPMPDDFLWLKEQAWFDWNPAGGAQPVALKSPNGFGLFDMRGNVNEWCQDWYDSEYYQRSPPNDPQGPVGGGDRVQRGGPWWSSLIGCNSGCRGSVGPSDRSDHRGFRVVRVTVTPPTGGMAHPAARSNKVKVRKGGTE
jgi:serine/threonine protein kinase/formylglycine-generating enzyme required for sulfatase activity